MTTLAHQIPAIGGTDKLTIMTKDANQTSFAFLSLAYFWQLELR